jgi:hypothetical protein
LVVMRTESGRVTGVTSVVTLIVGVLGCQGARQAGMVRALGSL